MFNRTIHMKKSNQSLIEAYTINYDINSSIKHQNSI